MKQFLGRARVAAVDLRSLFMGPRGVVVVEDERKNTDSSVERLMGNKPEARFEFIQERAEFADEEILDV